MITAVALLALVSSLPSCFAQHKVTLTNNCGHGTPKLIQGSNVLSTGQEYMSQGDLPAVISYLDNGNCGFNGEGCSMVEITLNGGSSSADISLIPPHAFSDPVGFEYTDGCPGQGAYCAEATCNTAYFVSNDDCVVMGCSASNAGVNIIFCPGQSTHFTDGRTGSPCHGGGNNSSSAAGSSTGGGSTSVAGSTAPGSSAGSTGATTGASNTGGTTTTTTTGAPSGVPSA